MRGRLLKGCPHSFTIDQLTERPQPELAALDDVLAGGRCFAELPPPI